MHSPPSSAPRTGADRRSAPRAGGGGTATCAPLSPTMPRSCRHGQGAAGARLSACRARRPCAAFRRRKRRGWWASGRLSPPTDGGREGARRRPQRPAHLFPRGHRGAARRPRPRRQGGAALLPHRKRAASTCRSSRSINFKGGSGKTTTAAHLAQYLALRGYRVLAIDLDPQASLSALFGHQPEFDVGENETLYGAIRYDEDRAAAARDHPRDLYSRASIWCRAISN